MTKKQKRVLVRLLFAVPLLALAILLRAFMPTLPFYIHLIAFLPAYLLAGGEVLWEAVGGMLHLRLFDETFLMSVATLGAFAIGEYPEAVFVMLFYRVGELFEGMATRKARRALTELSSLIPDSARLVDAEGRESVVDAEDVPVGACIRLLAGDRVPLDGVVVEGRCALDLSALTGEALPKEATVGDSLPAGGIALDGALILLTTRPMAESTAARILEMVENATDRKAKTEGFITRFARVYTPIVCLLALLAALLLPLCGLTFGESIYVALSFLVISCPCALVISVPLAFFAGVGGGARRGILFKGSRELERLASVRAAAFDKTGTLTHGNFRPTAFLPAPSVSEEELFRYAAAVESASSHPIARSVVSCYRERYGDTPLWVPQDVKECAGGGVTAMVSGKRVSVGKGEYLRAQGVNVPEISSEGGILYASMDGAYLGAILITDTIREDSEAALADLRRAGLSPLLLLSGDRPEIVSRVGEQLAIDLSVGGCLPEDKARIIAEEKEKTGKRFLFVGDGINDAPALASADCGMAMGALGSDAAESTADVVLLRDGLCDAATAFAIAKKTVRIVRANVVFILAVKGTVMLLSAFSLVGMWAAVFADVGVSVIAILNAVRAGRCRHR